MTYRTRNIREKEARELGPPIYEVTDDWKKVVFASECPPCDCCGEPVCEICEVHYAECECPGPTQDGVDYEEFNGVLYGRFTEEDE